MGLRSRNRLLDFALLLIALLGPLFHLAGFLTHGLALLYAEYSRLGFTYAVMALSAATGAVAVLRRSNLPLRLIAGAALLANLGSIGYVSNLWWPDMRRALADAAMSPTEAGRVGIALAPAGHGATARAEARALEDAIDDILERKHLGSYVIVRRAYPIASEEQAERVGQRLGASIVVWKTEEVDDLVTGEHHLTVLGANVTPIELAPLKVMLLMSTRASLVVPGAGTSEGSQVSPLSTDVIAPVSVGFACLALGQPTLAAAQFQNALTVAGIPAELRRSLHNYMGTALLFADRPDLAIQEYELAKSIEPDAYAWVGSGNSLMARREWRAAAEAFSEAIALDPYCAAPYCGLGIVFARERMTSRAISCYRQAVALQPTWGAPYALLGLAFELDANIDAAREAYRTCALQAGPNAGLRQAVTVRAEEILHHPPTAVPTATLVPTPSPTPIPTWGTYEVQKGDTLAAIASELGVSIDDLIEVNQIDNPNALSVGQILMLPRKSPLRPRTPTSLSDR